MSKSKIDIKFEYAGINSIRDLTKEELITCIERTVERDRSAKFWFERYALEIADKRAQKKLEEDEAKGDRWIKLQYEYSELLKPYSRKKLSDIPGEVLEKAAALAGKIEKAQKEYFATFQSR